MSPAPFHLSSEQAAQFEREGCLLIKSFFTKAKAKELHKRALELLDNFDLSDHPLTVFSTNEDEKHVGDEYFLGSGDKIRYFFEKDAFTNGKLNRPKHLAVNKIGHDLCLDPLFHDFTFSDDVKTLARELAFHEDPLVVQTMVICKQKEVGGKVGSHDDSTFLYTTPLSALGYWFALEDCTTKNGCLSFVPGSHKANPIRQRLERVEGGGTEIRPVAVQEGDSQVEARDWDGEGVEWRTLECEAGDLVLIHGSVVHRSEKNTSPRSRFIYTFHMIESEREGVKWADTNWLQPPPDGEFRRLFA